MSYTWLFLHKYILLYRDIPDFDASAQMMLQAECLEAMNTETRLQESCEAALASQQVTHLTRSCLCPIVIAAPMHKEAAWDAQLQFRAQPSVLPVRARHTFAG